MEKKIYTAPALSVEEFEMTEVICTSPVRNVQGGDMKLGGDDSEYRANGGTVRANNRGIWDED
jgi:hypothetical protein